MADTASIQDALPTMQERAESAKPSCVSMRSNQSIVQPVNFKDKETSEHSGIQQERSDTPELSCVSMKSDQSIEQPVNLKDRGNSEHSGIQERSDTPELSCVSMRSNCSIEQPVNFKDKGPSEHRIQQWRSDSPEPNYVSIKSHQAVEQPVNLKDRRTSENSNGSQLAEDLKTFKSNMMKKFQCLCEGIAKQGNPTLLKEIYTELYITESERGEISNEHEVRQIETQSRRTATEDTPIKCNDIFKPLPPRDKPIRTVLTKGVAGIGKTVSVQKFILDWAEGKENQDVHLIFPLPFRELNLIKEKKLTLLDLLCVFFPEAKEIEISSDEYKVLFLFDGFDECRLSLDFHGSVRLCDVSESASVDVLLTNLIKGNLLPSALIWITSRPAAVDLIPSECVDRVTEVRGFSDPQKEQYFRNRISDKSLANRIISHLKSSRSLYIMCHIPVFCWISATVLERMLSEAESGEIPKTLTQMYTHFLLIQTNVKHEKQYENKATDQDIIVKLGKLAFEQLVKGNLIFYEEDLRECGIDVAEAAVYSGLCTQIFREEFGLYQGKVYSFVHLSIQEHLAALYVHLTFLYKSLNAFTQITKPGFLSTVLDLMKSNSSKQVSICDLHQRAVDEALKSKNGHLDLFLRFLLGLSVESNQILLQGLIRQTESCCHSIEETADYIKQKIRKNPSEKSINLFYCLNELGDHSLMEEIQLYLKSGAVSETNLSSSQWSALVFVLLTSEQKMDVFKLNEFVAVQYNADEVFLKLLPVVKTSTSVLLTSCHISVKSCAALASALRSNPSHLRELDLSLNKLGNSGVKLLSSGLEDPHCKLKFLRLKECGVTGKGCAALASALRSNPSHLIVLQMSQNKLGDLGMKYLSSVLENPHCKLKTLSLRDCDVTDKGCAALASALRSNPSHLIVLELSWNKLGDLGVKHLSSVLENPHCELKTLSLGICGVTDKGCAALASALRSNPSHLIVLEVSRNKLGDLGVKHLSSVLENPHCKLETLGLNKCDVTDCAALASALRLNPSHLRKLDLSENKLGDSGVTQISAGLENTEVKLEQLWLWDCGFTDKGCAALTSALRLNPSHLRELILTGNNLGDSGMKLLLFLLENNDCNLERLWLDSCGITYGGCAALASTLRSNPSHLKELNLSHNKLGDSGVKLLCASLESPHCRLKILRLNFCGVKVEGCAALASALRSNPSHLRELNLNFNKRDSGVKLLSAVLEDPHCKLEILSLWDCGITEEGCVALAAALRSNPSHLRELDLSKNKPGDSGVKLLSAVLEDPHCKLEKLSLWDCGVKDEGCAALASALRSNPSHLRELSLSNNKLRDSGVKLLSAVLEDPHCKLEILRLSDCGVSGKGCDALASALRSNPSHLRQLDLSYNILDSSRIHLLYRLMYSPHYKLEYIDLRRCEVDPPGHWR